VILQRAIPPGLQSRYVDLSNTLVLQNGLPVQIWGFEQVNDERRYVRHVDFIGPENEHIQARLVYDFCELVLQLARSIA
jgi:hypothetical protein